MTKFTDQLFDDLMREHGPALAHTRVSATKRHLATRPVLLTAGASGLAVAATVGTLVAGGGTPAYAVTAHPDGTVTLAVYEQSGIAQANAKLHKLGDRVVVVPVRSGCPSINSLPAPGVPARQISVQGSRKSDGSVTVAARGVPAGDILVLGFQTTSGGGTSTSSAQGQGTAGSDYSTGIVGASKLTSGPVPGCVSIPVGSVPPAGKAKGSTSCAHSPASASGLTTSAQKGGSTSKSAKVSGSCPSSAEKGSHPTPAGSSGTQSSD